MTYVYLALVLVVFNVFRASVVTMLMNTKLFLSTKRQLFFVFKITNSQ